jgi:hypothetical protein
MLADIISQHPRRKMTLQELYVLLRERYTEHFPDDGEDDSKMSASGGGWRVPVLVWRKLTIEYGPTRAFRE